MNLADMNWKTWSLILVVVLGGTFELIKRLPSTRSMWDAGLRVITDSNETPYSIRRSRIALMERRQAPAMLPASRAPQIKRLPPAMATPPPLTAEQLAALVAKQQNEKKLQASDDGWEDVIDPKTGKKVKRKKKKKKKKIVKKEQSKSKDADHKYDEPKDSDNESDSSEGAIDAAITHSLVTGELAPLPPNEPDTPFESAEEWVRRLLNRPSLTETNQFIDHYKRNLVTSDVYYKVVRMMIDDSRPEMKKLGILAASQVYTPMSFQILAKVLQSNADSTVKEKAQEALKSYETYARLSVLEKILVSNSSSYNTVLATQKLQVSAETTFKVSGSKTSPTQASAEVVRTRQITAYKKFVPILTKLTQSQDSSIKDQANQTLGALQGLLGSTTAATQVDPQPTI